MDRHDILNLVDFWPARIILSAAELGLFTALDEPATAVELGARTFVDPVALERLLDALTALKLLAKDNGRYRIADGLEKALGSGPDSVVPMLAHRAVLWGKWSNLSEVVRSGAPVTDRYEDDQRPQAEVEAFIGAMAAVGRPSARDTVAALDLSGARTLLDIGGGPAVYAVEFLSANPNLRVVQLDLPRVCDLARRYAADSDVADRLAFVEGTALEVETATVLAPTVGAGYDVVFMSNLIHSMSEDEVIDLLGRCVGWVKPGGRIVVKDFLLNEQRTSPPQAAVFSINMLVATQGGRSYTAAEIGVWLRETVLSTGRGEPQVEQISLADGTSSLAVATLQQ